MRLYHGSKSGIEGPIAPISRATCDFGCGFNMYADPDQPRSLVCAFPTAHVYTLEADFSGLRTLDMGLCLDWAMLIAFNRSKMEGARDSALYRRCRETMSSCDVVSGPIANDRMFVVLDRFFSGEIADVALIRSLSALKLGSQYVCLTPEACERVRIVADEAMAPGERERLSDLSARMRREGVARADEICRRYRREGRFFDEILAGGTPDEGVLAGGPLAKGSLANESLAEGGGRDA